jgi:hypothetical protein
MSRTRDGRCADCPEGVWPRQTVTEGGRVRLPDPFWPAAFVEWLTRLIAQDAWPVWTQVLGPLLQAASWPLVGALLLAPQRRAFDRDDIRPL